MKKNIIISIGLLLSGFSYSQVGVDTVNPQGTFHIDGAKDNNKTGIPTTSQQLNDFVILPNGSVGIKTITPSVKVDARGVSGDAGIAVEYTTQSAADAGAGAIRYAPVSGGKLQYSDGSQWFDIQSKPPRVFIKAENTTGFSLVAQAGGYPVNWTESQDFTNSFNASTGIFIAPRDGNYMFNSAYCFDKGASSQGGAMEAHFIVSNTSGGTSYKFRKEGVGMADDNYMAVSGSVTIPLKKGDTVRPYIYNATNTYAKSLVTTSGFNILSIVEL